jgi:hypothetical protein
MTPAGRLRGVLSVGLALGLGLHTLAARAATQAADPELTALFAKVSEYVDDYRRTVASLVCEERYEQRVTRQALRVGDRISGAGLSPDVSTERRLLLSEYLLVKLPDADNWQPFRDVHTVDGRPVRDRDDRLRRLFLAPDSADPWRQADEIRFESHRYNIGQVIRDINLPTYVIDLLHESRRPRFAFRLRSRERVRGHQVRVIEYEETARPTLIRGRNDADSPARGRVWVLPDTGTIVQTRLETDADNLQTRIDVVFRPDAELGYWVPAEMKETHTLPGEKIEGTATYGHFRQFRVETSETIGAPR